MNIYIALGLIAVLTLIVVVSVISDFVVKSYRKKKLNEINVTYKPVKIKTPAEQIQDSLLWSLENEDWIVYENSERRLIIRNTNRPDLPTLGHRWTDYIDEDGRVIQGSYATFEGVWIGEKASKRVGLLVKEYYSKLKDDNVMKALNAWRESKVVTDVNHT